MHLVERAGDAADGLASGAAYTFAYERVAGSFGIGLSDRVVRFVAGSAIFHALLAGPELVL